MKKPIFRPTIPPLAITVGDVVLLIAGSRLPQWLLGATLGAAILWLVLASISVREAIIERWPKSRNWFPFLDPTGGLARKAQLSAMHVQGLTFRLIDAAVDGVVLGKTFDNCVIHGPAVIAPKGMTVIRAPEIHARYKNVIYDFGDNLVRTGMLVVEDCTFNNCFFYDIGFAQREDFLKNLRITIDPPPKTSEVTNLGDAD